MTTKRNYNPLNCGYTGTTGEEAPETLPPIRSALMYPAMGYKGTKRFIKFERCQMLESDSADGVFTPVSKEDIIPWTADIGNIKS